MDRVADDGLPPHGSTCPKERKKENELQAGMTEDPGSGQKKAIAMTGKSMHQTSSPYVPQKIMAMVFLSNSRGWRTDDPLIRRDPLARSPAGVAGRCRPRLRGRKKRKKKN